MKMHSFLESVYHIARKVTLTLRYFLFSDVIEVVEMLAWLFQNRATADWVIGDSEMGGKERAKEDEVGFG